jgi:hypothetical protein
MVYEWDPIRAKRSRKIKFAARLLLTISAFAVPAGILLTALTA